MSHGGLITGDLAGKLGSAVSFNKSGLRIQRAHNERKNTSGSDAQWDRWIRLSICSKAWRYFYNNGFTQLSERDFNKLNFAVAPYITYDQFLSCECPFAPWALSFPDNYYSSVLNDFLLGVDYGCFEDLISYSVSLGVRKSSFQKNLDLYTRSGASVWNTRSFMPPTEGLLKTWYKKIDGLKWGILGCSFNYRTIPEIYNDPVYPSYFPFVSVVSSASDLASLQGDSLELTFASDYSNLLHTSWTYIEEGGPCYSPRQGIDNPNMLPFSVEWDENFAGRYELALGGGVLSSLVDSSSSVRGYFNELSYDNSAFEDSLYYYLNFRMYSLLSNYDYNSFPLLFTIGGVTYNYLDNWQEYPQMIPYYSQYKFDPTFIERSISSWRSHRAGVVGL